MGGAQSLITTERLDASKLDPMLRDAAASTPGVELMLGQAAHGLLRASAVAAGGSLPRKFDADRPMRPRTPKLNNPIR